MPYLHIPNISLGNRAIDSEHKKIFDIIHRLQQSITAKDCAAIAAGFQLLKDIAIACFSVEEEIARAIGFDFTQHHLAHQNLLKKYQHLEDELATRNGSWSSWENEAYKNYIHDWLMKHLEYESGPLRIVLNTYLYDFKPA
jgi:hemerythrin-like metal-binding protein